MKYDWVGLEREFTTLKKYSAMSLSQFLREHGIPWNSNTSKHVSDWIRKRKAFADKKQSKIKDAVTEREVTREVETVERHYRLWNRFLDVVENGLKTPENMQALTGDDNLYKAVKGLADVLEKAQKGQRTSLGLDKPKDENENAEQKLAESFGLISKAFGGAEDDDD